MLIHPPQLVNGYTLIVSVRLFTKVHKNPLVMFGIIPLTDRNSNSQTDQQQSKQQVVKVISQKAALPPQTDSSIEFARWRQCAPPYNTRFLGPIRDHIPNSIWIGSAIFAQLTAECPYTLQWAIPFRLKIVPSRGGDRDPHLEPVPIFHILNSISISSTFLQGSQS